MSPERARLAPPVLHTGARRLQGVLGQGRHAGGASCPPCSPSRGAKWGSFRLLRAERHHCWETVSSNTAGLSPEFPLGGSVVAAPENLHFFSFKPGVPST